MKAKTKKRGTRTGFTTGACTAAAARAAVSGLVYGEIPKTIESLLPNEQRVTFSVFESVCKPGLSRAVVVKDAGDDPDCTDGAHLTVELCPIPAVGEIELIAGNGVGTITQPGLGLEVNGPAINPVPRKNIQDNIREVATEFLKVQGIRVVVSVPEGEAMSKKTLNSRLGIVGGISILGTTGIVRPYSTSAFRASVIQGIEVAAAQNQDTVVLTTGGRTEKFVIAHLPELASCCFIQMGDFLSYALDTAKSCQLKRVIIGGMVGKLTKMAQGETITHAGRAAVNTQLLADIAADCGAPASICQQISDGETARFAGECMNDLGLYELFHQRLASRVIETLASRYPNQFEIVVLVCDFDGNKIAEAKGNTQ